MQETKKILSLPELNISAFTVRIPAFNSHSEAVWAILKEESIRISNALVQVPFEQREVVVLHLHGGMKFREIAKLQAVSTKTIQSRYRYGLEKLKTLLNGQVKP